MRKILSAVLFLFLSYLFLPVYSNEVYVDDVKIDTDVIINNDEINTIVGKGDYNYRFSYTDKDGTVNETLNLKDVSYSNHQGSEVILNTNSIKSITADFVSNDVSEHSFGVAGLISNYSYIAGKTVKIDYIYGNFVSNTANSNQPFGGALINCSRNSTAIAVIDEIGGNFINNQLNASNWSQGGAISNYSWVGTANIGSISGRYIGNSIITTNSGYGGAISNYMLYANSYANIKSIDAIFIGNYIIGGTASRGGAISNCACRGVATIDVIKGYFYNNYVHVTGLSNASLGGAIANTALAGGTAYIKTIEGTFINNHIQNDGDGLTYGGAICNTMFISGEIKNSSFISNYAISKQSTALGGAIYTVNDTVILADNGISEFTGNYTESNGVKDDNAIYVGSADATLTFETKNNGSVVMNDNIDGLEGYQVNITGDNTGTFYLFNDIRNAGVNVSSTTINTVNNQVRKYNFDSFTVSGDTNMVVDVNLKNKTMDRITAKSYGEHSGILTVSGMNLMSDAKTKKTSIAFAEDGLRGNVATIVTEVGANTENSYQTKVYAPIFKYDVSYNPEDGNFMFVRGAGTTSNDFNPAVLSTPANVQTGAYVSQIQTFSQAFQHADNFMNVPSTERAMIKHQNKYASTNVGVFSPLMSGSEDKGFWVKPYAIFENVPLKNGPKVNAITYGTLIGYDEPMKNLKHGWDMVSTYYVGYNGSNQSYSGVDTYQNGGLLGSTLTLYKGNFFNATTLSVGATVGENHTMYGSDTFTSLVVGIGNKTGYNIEFKDGRFIVQPSMLLAYTFINTFDYTNAGGVRINSDPMSAIQIAPTMKFIANTKKGWQPYLTVGMVWNILAHSHVTANDITLPNMSIKPYVQYGLGIQKRFKDRLLAFGQAIIYNGGRNGVLLNVGLRWSIGK